MFEIRLYKSSAEPIVVDKTSQLGLVSTFYGTLRNSTSVVDPTIIFEFPAKVERVVDNDNLLVVDSDNQLVMYQEEKEQVLFDCNYAYIPKFNRYYFITDVVSVRANLWEVSMRCDVLMSYKDIIRQQRGLIARNEFDYDTTILDELRNYDYQPTIQLLEYDCGFTTSYQDIVILNMVHSNLIDSDGPNMGGSGSFSYDTYPSMNINSFRYVLNQQFMDILIMRGNTVGKFISDIMDSFDAEAIFWQSEPEEFIQSWIKLPFDIVNLIKSGLFEKIKGVDFKYAGNYYMPVDSNTSGSNNNFGYGFALTDRLPICIGNEFIIDLTNFNVPLDYLKYMSNIDIYFPYIGWQSFGSQYFLGCRILIRYLVDIVTGILTYYVYSDYTGEFVLIYNTGKDVSYKMTIGRTNNNEMARNAILTGVGTALSVAGGVASGAVEVANIMATSKISKKTGTISPKGQKRIAHATASSGVEIAGSISQGILDTIKGINAEPVASQQFGDILPFYDGNKLLIRVSHKTPIMPTDYNHLYGLPLYQERALNVLQGFTIIDDMHLVGFTNTTSDELSEIESLLLSGVIF